MLCAAVAAVLVPAAAQADDSEIGFDLHAGKFSAALPYMMPVQIGVDAPDHTSLTGEVWRRIGRDPCRLAIARSKQEQTHRIELAGVPTPDAGNGCRKLTVGGTAFMRAFAEAGLRERDVSVFAFSPEDPPPTCTAPRHRTVWAVVRPNVRDLAFFMMFLFTPHLRAAPPRAALAA